MSYHEGYAGSVFNIEPFTDKWEREYRKLGDANFFLSLFTLAIGIFVSFAIWDDTGSSIALHSAIAHVLIILVPCVSALSIAVLNVLTQHITDNEKTFIYNHCEVIVDLSMSMAWKLAIVISIVMLSLASGIANALTLCLVAALVFGLIQLMKFVYRLNKKVSKLND